MNDKIHKGRLISRGEKKPANRRRGELIGGYLPAALAEEFKERAKSENKTVSQLLEELITGYLKN